MDALVMKIYKKREKRIVFCVFIALMPSKMSVSYLVHTPCIPIRNDIDSLCAKKKRDGRCAPKRKAKWKMKISIVCK